MQDNLYPKVSRFSTFFLYPFAYGEESRKTILDRLKQPEGRWKIMSVSH